MNRSESQTDDLLRGERAGALVMAARVAMRRGDKATARTKLQEAFALHPTDCGALELLGDIFLEEAEQQKAIAVFQRGLKYHPRHHPFEEKIALALLDIEEMKRDQLLREQVLQHGDTGKWQDRKPGVAASLSAVVPGAGQFYNDEMERGAWFLGLAALTFCAWYFPLNGAIETVRRGGNRAMLNSVGAAVHSLAGIGKAWFWLMLLGWIAVYLIAAYDAWAGAERANRARRRTFGV